MKRLYEACDRIEAQLLHDYLAARHIQTVIHGDYLSGGAGELSALNFPQLWVIEDRDLERARQLLDERERQLAGKAETGPWHCPRCGNEVDAGFDLCWHCGSPRPEA